MKWSLVNFSKKYLFFMFLFIPFIIYANDDLIIEKIVKSLLKDRNIINANKQYELSFIDQKYHYLQWWVPSLSLSNNLIYPYKHGFFDNIATSNYSSFDLQLPLPTGSIINFGSSYSVARDLFETSTLEKQYWGLTQDLNISIGISQSLNPWWFHSRLNPYKRTAVIGNSLQKNDYNILMKNTLFNAVTNYINLRKIERNIAHIRQTLIFYDKLLQAYRQLLTMGGTSWREYEKINSEKWEYESNLFALEKERVSIQSELYRFTGMQIENTYHEELLNPNNSLFMSVFMDVKKEEINVLEETSMYLMNEKTELTRLIDRQVNAPLLMTAWSTKYKLPISPKDSMGKVWKRENFDNNILNNWSLTIALDLSSYLTPLNRRNTLKFNEEIRSINELLHIITLEKQKEKLILNTTIEQIQEQIEGLTVLLNSESTRLLEDETLKNRGIITILDYEQAQLSYQEKQTLLNNLQDDLWFYTFLLSFY